MLEETHEDAAIRLLDLLQLEQIASGYPSQERFLTELPSKIDPFQVLAITAMALILSFLATLYPAWKAAGTDPVEVLRYE